MNPALAQIITAVQYLCDVDGINPRKVWSADLEFSVRDGEPAFSGRLSLLSMYAYWSSVESQAARLHGEAVPA